MGLVLREILRTDQAIVDVLIMKMQLQLVEKEGLHSCGRPLRLNLDFFLIVVEQLKHFCFELGWLHLQIVMVLKYKHITIACHKYVYDLLVVLCDSIVAACR